MPHTETPSRPVTSQRSGRLDHISADDRLFVYGTLQYPEVLDILIGRAPNSTPATAAGWRAAALTDCVYPGLVPAAGHIVSGTLIENLTREEWEVLDHFEDDIYALQPLQISDGGHAWTYVWPRAVRSSNWSPEGFTIDHLPDYLTNCVDWKERHGGQHR